MLYKKILIFFCVCFTGLIIYSCSPDNKTRNSTYIAKGDTISIEQVGNNYVASIPISDSTSTIKHKVWMSLNFYKNRPDTPPMPKSVNVLRQNYIVIQDCTKTLN
jgi:hypothetical protein